jgi:hypothetical protein
MALTRVEKERLTDSRLKLQSVARSLRAVDRNQVPGYEEIEDCLEDADRNLGKALRSASPDSPQR